MERVELLNKVIPAILVLVLLVVGVPGRSRADEPSVEEVVGRVKGVYAKSCCFKARFDQVTVNMAMNIKDHFQGTMYVRKPAHIALEVESPEKQKVVLTGRSYAVYFPEDGNATRGEVPPDLNVERFFGFFGNIESVDRNFDITFSTRPADADDNLYFLELTDRKDKGSTFSIVLGIDSRQFTIRRAIIYDALGNYNRFNLMETAFLDSVPESRFRVDYSASKSPKPEQSQTNPPSDRK